MAAALGALTLLLVVVFVIHAAQSEPSDESMGSMTVTRSGDLVLMSSNFDGSRLDVVATTRNLATNGGFNLLRTTLDGSLIHNTGDDVAPIRTQMGTVGGNHGFSMVEAFTNPDGKTEADLGSVWTDSSREYVLLAIDKGGKLIMGGDYATSSRGVTSKPVAPGRELTHVSGGVHPGQVVAGGVATQLHPSTGRVLVTAFCDGAILDDIAQCREVTVRESYEVLNYADLYEQAKRHVGESYEKLAVDGMVRFENTYRFTANGRALVSAEVTALASMTLRETGLLQSNALTSGKDGTVIRQLPGVRPIEGYDFQRGVDLREYARDERVTAGDLLKRTAPPTFSLDRIVSQGHTRAGFAIGYIPTGSHAGSQTARSKVAGAIYWDLRSTRKSYPVALSGLQLRNGASFRVQGFRTYLTAEQADKISAAVATDLPPAAFVGLWS